MTDAFGLRLGCLDVVVEAAEPVTGELRLALDGLVVDADHSAGAVRLLIEAEGGRWRAFVDDRAFGPSAADPGAVVDRIVSWCTRTAVAHPEHDVELQLHAGGVVHPDGRAIVVVGRSGAGKTTVTAAALLEGWDHLSDELVGVDDRGRAVGHPKALTVKPPTEQILGSQVAPPPGASRHRWYVPAAALGSATVDRCPIGAVVVLDADPAPPVWLSPAPAAAAIALHVPATLDDRRLGALARLAGSVPVVAVGRRDPSELLSIGVEALERANPRSVVRRASVPRAVPAPIGPTAADGAIAVAVDGDLLVSVPGRAAVALDPAAALIWQLLDGAADIGGLVDEVAAATGHDRDAVAQRVVPLLRRLRAAGVVIG